MKLKYKISREALKKQDYKKRETIKVGDAPISRDTEALAELFKAIKRMQK
jgi:hypothetical protein